MSPDLPAAMELAAGTAEDAMRPAVLSTLRAFRRDLLADCEDRS